MNLSVCLCVYGEEEGQPQKILTFSSFSRPSHLEILVLSTERGAYLLNIVYGAYTFFYIFKIVWENLVFSNIILERR